MRYCVKAKGTLRKLSKKTQQLLWPQLEQLQWEGKEGLLLKQRIYVLLCISYKWKFFQFLILKIPNIIWIFKGFLVSIILSPKLFHALLQGNCYLLNVMLQKHLIWTLPICLCCLKEENIWPVFDHTFFLKWKHPPICDSYKRWVWKFWDKPHLSPGTQLKLIKTYWEKRSWGKVWWIFNPFTNIGKPAPTQYRQKLECVLN